MPSEEETSSATCVIVIVHWNTPAETARTVCALLCDTVTGSARVVIVDNASSAAHLKALVDRLAYWNPVIHKTDDGSPVSTPSSTSPLTILLSQRNLGFGGGCNLGIAYARRSGSPDYVWLLNSDTVPASGCLNQLLAEAQSDEAADLIGATIVPPEDTDRVAIAGGGRYLFWLDATLYPGRGRRVSDGRTLRPRLNHLSGASLFVRSTVFKSIGLLEDRSLLYYEEIDLCRRAAAAGFTLSWCPQAVVEHGLGASTHVGKRRTELKEYHTSRSALAFFRRTRPRLWVIPASCRLIRRALLCVIQRRFDLLRALIKAYWEHLCHRPERIPTGSEL